MDNINELTDQDRLDLAEICCHPESELSKTCETLGGKAMRLSIGTGYDLLTNEGTLRALSELVARSPKYSWFRPRVPHSVPGSATTRRMPVKSS